MKLLISLLLVVGVAHAGTVATLPNKAGGKIVLTDEACVIRGKHYKDLNRTYNYGASGSTSEGCWTIEGETVLVAWEDDDKARRYPIENFTLNPNYKQKGSNNRGYNY